MSEKDQEPTRPAGGERPAAGHSRLVPGLRIGFYKLLQRIGEGGMGEVWLAEQEEPIRRRVALKIVKRGLDTDQIVARFEAERQALAMMDHPAVARVFDAGSTPDGRPYFVMEYVQGETITAYCDRHRLSIADRLRVFQQVCEGVQHAHQKGIIHRDLKPSNVLVAVIENDPQPKVIDFGVAKATQQRLTERTLFTELGVMVGTPEYMSPEQAEASCLDVDTRTDVYSLGVMLYELLSGVLPFDPRELRQAGLDVIRQRIRDEEPSRPSDRMSTQGAGSSEIAKRRGTDPLRLAGSLRGDLDWITMKAMDKDRRRRYGSPTELSADIERYLCDEPVHARAPSAVYRTEKFLRRHRLAVGLAAVSVLALLGFSGSMAWQTRKTSAERSRAEWVSRFLVDLFLSPDPEMARGRMPTARDLLDRGAERIQSDPSADPLLRARVMAMLGRTYEGLGLYEDAARMTGQAYEIQRERLGPEDAATIGTLHNLALVNWDLGRVDESVALYREAIECGLRGLGERDPLTLTSMGNLATTLSTLGRYAEAESLAHRTLELRREVRGPDHMETLSSAADLATIWQAQGRVAEAESLFRATVASMSRVLGDESPETLKTKYNLAVALNVLRRYDEAGTVYREALDGMKAVLGVDHPNTLSCMMAVAMNDANRGRYPEAEALLRETLDVQRRTLGDRHPRTLFTVYNLGCLAALKGDRQGALAWLREAVRQGYAEPDWMNRDSDLESLREEDEFRAIVDDARRNAASRAAAEGIGPG